MLVRPVRRGGIPLRSYKEEFRCSPCLTGLALQCPLTYRGTSSRVPLEKEFAQFSPSHRSHKAVPADLIEWPIDARRYLSLSLTPQVIFKACIMPCMKCGLPSFASGR